MRPLFSYYGSKQRLCQQGFYPIPKHGNVVIEPFAGSATYSVYHEIEIAVLIDKDPIIINVWNYLINASKDEIAALPSFGKYGKYPFCDFEKVMQDQIEAVNNLIGFWIFKAVTRPGKTVSTWFAKYADTNQCMVWNEAVKNRIIKQLPKIKKWQAYVGDYTLMDQLCCYDSKKLTLFIDPPYSGKCGNRYTYSDIDYQRLAHWLANHAKDENLQIIACENEDLTHRWANFNQRHTGFTLRGKKQELAFVQG